MIMKKYYEFNSEAELNKHLKYWSNACGELHHHGEYELNDISELPEELQRAYTTLWVEGYGCLEYLAEYDGKYYIALISEFDDDFAKNNELSMDELYETVKKNAFALYEKELFNNTVLVIGKETGINECHEFIFLVPAMESKNVYDAIENEIYVNIWKDKIENEKKVLTLQEVNGHKIRMADESYVIDETYVLTPVKNAFNPKTSYWMAKDGFTVAYYCFTADTKREVEYMIKNIDGYIEYFEHSLTKSRLDSESIGRLVDSVEDWLEERGINLDVPSQQECDAIINGNDYDSLASRFRTALGIGEK